MVKKDYSKIVTIETICKDIQSICKNGDFEFVEQLSFKVNEAIKDSIKQKKQKRIDELQKELEYLKKFIKKFFF